MDCPSCGHANRPEARFCGACGESLLEAIRCPGCGVENPPGQKFCDGCGRPLAPSAGERPAAAPAIDLGPPDHLAERIRAGADALEGERKQVTVLFADVVGSMELAAQAGPETWRAIMERFFSLCCDAVHRFEGSVDKFTGDGAMALFGAPLAHEDHAQRACYAALAMREELVDYAAELRRAEGLNVSVRMGLNSGEVIVGAIGDDLGMEYTAIGETVGLAQRMEALAEPGKVYVAQDTAALVDGFLALRELGDFEVKGIGEPVAVHELTGLGPARGRLDVSRGRGFSKFVGRSEEMRLLESALERASEGEGQVIGLVGEAGVGKSRLCHEYAQRARARGMPTYHAAAQAHTRDVPLLPVLQLMRTYFDITELDSGQTARERIAGKLLLLDEGFAEDLPLMFDFLSVPDPDRMPPHLDPEVRQRKLLGLTKRLIRTQSDREPGVTIFEDLHWIDPGSEAFLANHIEATQGTKSLTIVNFRPPYRADWMSKSYYRQIALAPLGPAAIEELIADLLGSDPSLEGLAERIRERTGGNPFFIEEVSRSLVEAGNLEGERSGYRLVKPIEEASVPASVQAVLAARIDRLEEREKTVLQNAAVIGKEFPEGLLRRIVERDRTELEDALRDLIAGEFVLEQEVYPETLLAFKHPLTQEVAYGSQLAERRASVHAAVARALAEERPERANENAALLAHHWEAAGERLEAARWNAVAAAWTGTRDPEVSLRHWRKVNELTDALPESEETVSLGLAARIFLLQYGWRLGISHAEAESVFNEAERIAAKAGDIRSRSMLLAVYSSNRCTNDGDVRGSADLARRAIALAEESGHVDLFFTVVLTSYAFALSGEYREAVDLLDRAVELADGDVTVAAGVAVGCPYAHCFIFRGGYSITLGELEKAEGLIETGMKIAQERKDLEVMGWGHTWSTFLAFYSGSHEEMLGHARQALEISERLGSTFSRCWAWYALGLAELAHENWHGAVDAFERSISISREGGVAVEGEPQRLANLAEALLGRGDRERATEVAREAVECARAQDNVQGVMVARLSQGTVLLAARGAAAHEEIEAALGESMEIAHRAGARVYEPRIHACGAELARATGDRQAWQDGLREAHRLCTEIGAAGFARRLGAALERIEA